MIFTLAALQLSPLQPRLATTVVSTEAGTPLFSLSSLTTAVTAVASAADTSWVLPPLLSSSFTLVVLAALASVSTTHLVLLPLSAPLQPSAPVLAIWATAVSISAIFFSSSLAPLASAAFTLTVAGSKPSNWATATLACSVLALVKPPVAVSAALAVISENGVTLVLTLAVSVAGAT